MENMNTVISFESKSRLTNNSVKFFDFSEIKKHNFIFFVNHFLEGTKVMIGFGRVLKMIFSRIIASTEYSPFSFLSAARTPKGGDTFVILPVIVWCPKTRIGVPDSSKWMSPNFFPPKPS